MTDYALRLANIQDTAPRVRMGDALALTHNGPLNARSGLRPDGGGIVTVVGGSMTVQVTAFMAWVDGGTALQGGFPFVNDATKTLTIADGHASLSRTDTVAVVIHETTFDGSGSTDAAVVVVQGTPGGGAPVLPSTALPIRDITVPAGLSAGTGGLASGNLATDRRLWLAATGGVLRVAGITERDALIMVEGQTIYRADIDALQTFNGFTWDTYAKQAPSRDLLAVVTAGADFTLQEVRAAKNGDVVTISGRATYVGATRSGGTDGNVTNTALFTGLPVDLRPPVQAPVMFNFGGSGAGNGLVRNGGDILLGGIYPGSSIPATTGVEFFATFVM